MKNRLPILLLLTSASVSVDAWSEDASEVDNTVVDEITVVGAKPVIQIRREIRKLDSVIYSTYNELNDDDQYDIICRLRASTGSQIKRNNCKAKLYWDALSETTEDGDDGLDIRNVVAWKTDHGAKLRENLLSIASENDELLKALIERQRLAKQLELAKSK